MAEVVYVSEARIERVKGPLRRAFLPAEKEPVLFGVHGAVAEHYGVTQKVDRAYAIHAENCPVYLSLRAAIDITTELDWQELN